MKIMVFDVSAESGGALSVLHDYYSEFNLYRENEYIFVLSLADLSETINIKVLRFPWIKKSWVHRLYFDHFIAPKLIKRFLVDEIISLQNITIPHTSVYQSVFVHNALPFSEYKFSINEDRLLWIYQNVIGKLIIKSIKKADHVIVQTRWMMNQCAEKLQINLQKFEVKPPKIDIEIKKLYKKNQNSLSTFFYPASGVLFKNHKIIVEACLSLKKDGVTDYKVTFTLYGNENRNIKELYNIVINNELPIEFIGDLTRDQVFEYYSNSILLFPSYIETVGLPLLEARMHETPILVSDCAFAHEILHGYDNTIFFNQFNSTEIARLIKNSCKS